MAKIYVASSWRNQYDSGRWYIHVEGKPDNLVCIISIAKVRNLLGKGTVSFPGKDKDGEKG